MAQTSSLEDVESGAGGMRRSTSLIGGLFGWVSGSRSQSTEEESAPSKSPVAVTPEPQRKLYPESLSSLASIPVTPDSGKRRKTEDESASDPVKRQPEEVELPAPKTRRVEPNRTRAATAMLAVLEDAEPISKVPVVPEIVNPYQSVATTTSPSRPVASPKSNRTPPVSLAPASTSAPALTFAPAPASVPVPISAPAAAPITPAPAGLVLKHFVAKTYPESAKTAASAIPLEKLPSFNFDVEHPKPIDINTPTRSASSNPSSTGPVISLPVEKEQKIVNASTLASAPAEPSAQKPIFSFGNSEKPVFSFSAGKPAEKASEKPTFSFGNSASFSFTKPTTKPDPPSNEKPLFSFGQSTGKPSFSFGQATGNTTVSFAQPQEKPIEAEAHITSNTTESSTDTSVEQTTFASGEGEEDEETQHEARVKIWKLAEGKWQDLGVTIFKIKKHKESRKCRVLARNAVNGNVVLNFNLYASLAVSQDKGVLTFLGFENAKPLNLRCKLKTAETAQALKAALEANTPSK
ncbi:hypothetical protein MCUN1_003232 [Malassezia cuniculi]|uniref:RanBD1 domain-containing protein n=1 Tax=Malassezia cuniculi TaxID=948313 RepID=A0AAF0F156_9BASI|nr:hypothetical protein MCUN1_003232 [Malassezia cuniculi]